MAAGDILTETIDGEEVEACADCGALFIGAAEIAEVRRDGNRIVIHAHCMMETDEVA